MIYFIAGNTAVESARSLAESALPNAPQVEHHEPAPRRTVAARARLGAVLRYAAERELKLADRLDPAPRCEPLAG
ncbi:hypothetical protein [Kribbella sp. CA-293567]|uniref:hypothetical protein n=1 Tax=Kribbella sp. CA-293567 TaxID=3002436 RepID=UPI0022DD2839|nr:hypothetical protein [Kribbella sp. CA-293567]WBQ06550.1 hypothetical protein OX958_07080 [Kribbella sp. CA-293567]